MFSITITFFKLNVRAKTNWEGELKVVTYKHISTKIFNNYIINLGVKACIKFQLNRFLGML